MRKSLVISKDIEPHLLIVCYVPRTDCGKSTEEFWMGGRQNGLVASWLEPLASSATFLPWAGMNNALLTPALARSFSGPFASPGSSDPGIIGATLWVLYPLC